MFPILEMNTRADLMIYCCDLSETAVQLVKDHPEYRRGRCHSWVCDVTQDSWDDAPFPPNSLDIVTMIFVLSAVSPAVVEEGGRVVGQVGKVGFNEKRCPGLRNSTKVVRDPSSAQDLKP